MLNGEIMLDFVNPSNEKKSENQLEFVTLIIDKIFLPLTLYVS